MLSTEHINDLNRLYWSERWPIRKSSATSAWVGAPSASTSKPALTIMIENLTLPLNQSHELVTARLV